MRLLLVAATLLLATRAGSYPNGRDSDKLGSTERTRIDGGGLTRPHLDKTMRYQAIRAAPDSKRAIIPQSAYDTALHGRKSQRIRRHARPADSMLVRENIGEGELVRSRIDRRRRRRRRSVSTEEGLNATSDASKRRRQSSPSMTSPPYRRERIELEKITAQFKKLSEAQMDKFCQYLLADAIGDPLRMLGNLVGPVESDEVLDSNVHYDRNRGRKLSGTADSQQRQKLILRWACQDRHYGLRFQEMIMGGDAARSLGGTPRDHPVVMAGKGDEYADPKKEIVQDSEEFPYDFARDDRLVVKPIEYSTRIRP